MITFIYTVLPHSRSRGYNRTITVYRVKNNIPSFIGSNEKIDTASYYGDRPSAMHIICDNTDFKMDGSYHMKRKGIRLIEV